MCPDTKRKEHGLLETEKIGKTGKHSSGHGASKHSGPAVGAGGAGGRRSLSACPADAITQPTDLWSAPSLCQSLCWVRGLPRRCSEPVPGQGEETNAITTQNVLGWREEAQEKGSDSVCVGIRALRENWIQCISRSIYGALFLRMQEGKVRESAFPLNRKSSSHPRSEWRMVPCRQQVALEYLLGAHVMQEAGAHTAQMHARQKLHHL